ncbi:MAG: quinolinate synthase NadA [Spirochaetes bacterium]|nr:quinolinate synthase NadA [Spirochaetota bacterium]
MNHPDHHTPESLFEKLRKVQAGGCAVNLERCRAIAPIVNEILDLKREKNAVILAHSYVSSEIVYGVADFTGDSYKLAKDALGARASTIVFAAVKFMAETAKILNPERTVLVPNELNGCSLADAITGAKVRELRAAHPDHAFLCYINTTADVKAECDVCVTSSNVHDIVERHPSKKIFFVPDRLMGLNILDEMKRRGVEKEILLYDGTCYVHETYDALAVFSLRQKYPGLKVLAHPECKPEVARAADFMGSTAEMLKYVKAAPEETYLMLTECGLSNRLEVEVPRAKFVGSCTLCKYMKANTLSDVLRVLKSPRPQDAISIEEGVRLRAKKCIDAMFDYAEKGSGALG